MFLCVILFLCGLSKATRPNTLAFWTQEQAFLNAFYSKDFDLTGATISHGETYVSKTTMFTERNNTGTDLGFVALHCTILVDSFAQAHCTASVVFKDDSGMINVEGFYAEQPEGPETPSVNTLAVQGGTGNYIGVSGEMVVSHYPVGPEPHYVHDYNFEIILQQNVL